MNKPGARVKDDADVKRIKLIWAKMPEDLRNVLMLYHYGNTTPCEMYSLKVDRTITGIRNKLAGCRPNAGIKKWAKGMLAYWSTIQYGLEYFKRSDMYAITKL